MTTLKGNAVQATSHPPLAAELAAQRAWAALFVALSCTGLIVFHVGSIPITAFLVALPLATPALVVYVGRHPRHWRTAALLAVVIVGSSTIHPSATDWISVAYSFVFITAFVLMMDSRGVISRAAFVRLLKIVIIIYFVNVVVAQALILVSAPDDFLAIFTRHTDPLRDDVGLRYYGFANEPSYAAFVILGAFVALLKTRDGLVKNDLITYGGMVAYQVIAFRSVYGYVLVSALLLRYAYHRLSKPTFWIACVLAIAALTVFSDELGKGRFGHLVQTVLTQKLDSIESLDDVDSSLFMRGAPVVYYFETADLGDRDTYLGHGPMTHEEAYTTLFSAWLEDEGVFQPGFLPGFFYDFGIIGALLVLITLGGLISDHLVSIENLFFGMVLFNANFNTLLFWFVIVVFAAAKAYRRDAAC
jgi:hypothetical protein